MLIMFALTCLFYWGDQLLWEKDHQMPVIEWHQSPDIADYYEGYLEPGWIDVVYVLQLPGLLPVRAFADPLPLHTRADWRIYATDGVSILAAWYLIGLWFEGKRKLQTACV